MRTFWKDVRQSLRALLKRPAFFAAAVSTLALGIGANTAVFSVVNAVLLRQLPFRNADRAYWITEVRPERNDAPFSLPDFLDYRDRTSSLDALSAVGPWSASLTGRGNPEQLIGVRVSANLFQNLGVDAAFGRTLVAEDDRPGRANVVVIAYALFQRRFGTDASVLGQSLDLNGASYTLVGILPPSFVLPIPDAELAVPLVPDADPWRFNRNTVNFLRLVGRTRPETTPEQAAAEMNALARTLREQFPIANARKLGVKLTPLRDQITGGYRRALWLLLGAVAVVLLIVCANLANLNLVRADERRREVSIRTALGATRRQIVQMFLVEGALLACAGGMLGALLARFGVPALVALSPSSIPRAEEIRMDSSALVFTALISLIAAMAAGLALAASLSRDDLAQRLSDGARGSTGTRRGKALRAGLVIAEVALSVILLAAAGVLLKSFSKVQNVRTGFDARGVLAVRLSLPEARYPHRADLARFYDALIPRVLALPGVSAVGVIDALPMSGTISSIPFTVVGQSFSKEQIPEAQYRTVSPGYLRVMRIPLLAGREFNERDTDTTPLVCYVNETLAARYWRHGDAIGSRLRLNDNDTGPREAVIVGIIPDVRDLGLEASPGFDVYIPFRQVDEDGVVWLRNSQFWTLRTQSDPLALAGPFRERLRGLDADVAASNPRSMEQYLSLAIAPRRFNLQLLSFFALAALALAMAGIYGVISYSVSRRMHEIAVRMALGAQSSHVLTMVIAEGARHVLAGLAVGILGVFALGSVLAAFVFNVSPSDPATLAGVSLLFACISLGALYFPARRATRIDPLNVLRLG